jgi:hypothetical protein
MSELLSNLWMGFHVAANPFNILFCLLGALVGTLVGVLPGIGTVATIAMLLPITFGLPPVGALIMLAGIYYGAQYGGSTTSVLVNIPGEATSVITCLDGHQMARQGRAGPASRCCSGRPNISRSWSWASSSRWCWRRARCSKPSPWSLPACCSRWSARISRPAPAA